MYMFSIILGVANMKVIKPGHRYIIDELDAPDGAPETSMIQFVDRGHGRNEQGTTCQELLRVLIDRVKFLESELHWERNKEIIFHLRKALLLFEVRALERKLEKNQILPENLWVNSVDGHWLVKQTEV